MDSKSKLGPYSLVKRLGDGPHGTCYVVQRGRQKGQLVLKLLARGESWTDAAPRLAQLERDVARLTMDHPNVVPPTSAGYLEEVPDRREGGALYLVSDHIEGPDLYRFSSRAAWSTVMEVVVSLLRGLEALHGHGLIHGHLCAENAIVFGQGPRKSARLLDGGLAADVAETRTLGLQTSWAPEVLAGSSPDRRADLYDLGVLLFACATRSPLFEDEDDQVRAHMSLEPVRARSIKRSVPVAMDDLIASLLQKDPAARPPSANAVIRELNRRANKRFSTETRDVHLSIPLRPAFQGREAALNGLVDPQAASTLTLVSAEVGLGRTRLLAEVERVLSSRPREGEVEGARPARCLRLDQPTLAGLVSGLAELEDRAEVDPFLREAPFLGVASPSKTQTPAVLSAPLPGARQRQRCVESSSRLLLAHAAHAPLTLLVDAVPRADPLLNEALRLATLDLRPGATGALRIDDAVEAGDAAEGEDSAEVLVPLAPHARLRMILSLAPDEVYGRPAEGPLKALSALEGVEELHLEPLGDDAVESLLAGSVGRDVQEVRDLVGPLAEAVAGSPGQAMDLLAELAQGGRIPPPDGAWTFEADLTPLLQQSGGPAALARRCGALPPAGQPAVRLARALALCGGNADVPILASALGWDPYELFGRARTLERMGLATLSHVSPESKGALCLTSARTSDALLGGMEPSEREELHGLLGAAYGGVANPAGRGASQGLEAPYWAATHLLRSKTPRDGVGHAVVAAKQALARHEPERVVDLLEAALRALEGPEAKSVHELPENVRNALAGDPRVTCQRLLGETYMALGRSGQARSAAQRAFSVAREGRDGRGMIQAGLLLSRAARASGDAAQAKLACEDAVEVGRGSDWKKGLALALHERGLAEELAGDRPEALASLEAARALYASRGDSRELASLVRDAARLRLDLGDPAGAGEELRIALDIDEEADRSAEIAEALLLRTRIEREQGDLDAALETAARARSIAQEVLDLEGAARALGAQAEALRARGELRSARRHEEAALHLWERTGERTWSARTRLELGRIQLASGELVAAEANLGQAAQTFKQLGDKAQQAEIGLTLAQAYLLRGELSRARDSLERAQQDAVQAGAGRTMHRVRAQTARLALVQGDLLRAEESAERVAEDAARQGLVEVEALARVVLGVARLSRGRPQDAERQLRSALQLAEDRGSRTLEARARLAIARVHLVRGEPAGALGELSSARDLAHDLEDVHLEVSSLLALGQLHRFLGQHKRAGVILEMARQRVGEINLALARPEVALASAACFLEQARGAWIRDEDPSGALAEWLTQADAQLEIADRGLRAGSRRGLLAELDLLKAERAWLSGAFASARERAESAAEVLRITGNTLWAARAERATARARVEQGRHEEALASAERAVTAAEGIQDGESQAAALLERGLARRKMGQVLQAAQDLREAASQVRGIWASLSEDLRSDYAAKPLVREVIKLAKEVGEEAEALLAASGGSGDVSGSYAPTSVTSSSGTTSLAPAASNVSAADSSADTLESLRDPLTNLFNHTFFTAQLENEIRRGQRHSRPLALLKINVDRFKLVRELYGPKAAKEILREVSVLLLRNVRDVDIVARYFGDEFEVLLPDTDQHGALLTSKRISEAVEGHRFEHDEEKIELTLTIGVAQFPRDAKDKDALICRVDEALYNARSRGPNQVFTFGAAAEEPPHQDTARELRELDEMMLTREGRTILSMVQRLVNQELDIDRMIELVTGMVVEATRGERGFIMLRGANSEFSFRHGRHLDDKVVNLPELKISNNIAKDVARTGKPIHVSEAIEDDRFRDFKSVMDLGLRSIICAPIRVDETVLGVIYVDHNQVARNFTPEDLNFLTAIADKVAIPLSNSKRLRETEDKLALAEARLKSQAAQLQTKYKYESIIGRSEPMQLVFKLLDRIVETNHSVVIHGESGTGKELIARAIHFNGPRKAKPFVAENCAALSDTLLEAELFGHVKGAFTGADRDSKGLFELANGGTLFLDEIGDMSERMQKKLLRVLQEGEVRPVGGKRVFHVDVRIVSASNKDLKRLVQERQFREDLYYRLNVITVSLPPLRDRREDVMLLSQHFLEAHRKAGHERHVDRETMSLLMNYDWPGNVRELENEINRLVAMSDDFVTPESLSPKIREGGQPEASGDDTLSRFYGRPLKDVEFEFMREIIIHTLEATNWHRTKAAKVLKVPTSTLFNKMKKYQIG